MDTGHGVSGEGQTRLVRQGNGGGMAYTQGKRVTTATERVAEGRGRSGRGVRVTKGRSAGARLAACGAAFLLFFCMLCAGFSVNAAVVYADLGGGGWVDVGEEDGDLGDDGFGFGGDDGFGFGGDDGFGFGGDDGFGFGEDDGNLGGDGGEDEFGKPFAVWFDIESDENGRETITGVDSRLLAVLHTDPLYANVQKNLLIEIPLNYTGVAYVIANEAFHNGLAKYDGLVFTSLFFQRRSDYPWDYTEGDIQSYITAIGDNAFQQCAFKTADMSELSLLTDIGEYAFYACASLGTVDLSGSAIKRIGDYAFADCGELYSINLDGCTDVSLGTGAFENCAKLTALELSNSGVVSIGDRAFGANVGLTQINFADAPVTTIGEMAFYNTGIETLDLTGLRGLTEIKSQAFGNCQNLKTVRMGYVPSVSADIFTLCSSLESIVFDSKETYGRYVEAGTFSALSVALTYDGAAKRLEPRDIVLIAAAVAVLLAAAGVVVYVCLIRPSAAVRDAAVPADETGLFEQAHANDAACGASTTLPATLTRREREVALLMLEGKKRKEIVSTLYISENTIKTHVTKILEKTECKNQLDFVVRYKLRPAQDSQKQNAQ